MTPEPAACTLLVVDDEDVIVAVVRRILSADGFTVRTCADAEAGLAALSGAAPDVALVDLQLPGLSGIDFIEAARQVDPQLPVVVMTGYASVDNAVASLQRGAFDFLPKPFTFDELRSPLYRAWRARTLGVPAPSPPAGYVLLGRQGWARPEPDGTAVLGLTPAFAAAAGAFTRIALPEADGLLLQGGPLARLTAADGLVHVAWSALGGHVVAVNRLLETTPALAAADPFGAGWIARIRPLDLEAEQANLIA